jgi:hypothetical protein
MPRRPSFRTIKNEFLRVLDSAENLHAAVEPFCARTYDGMEVNPLHPSQARKVVALAFLSAVAGWDDYVECVFLRYLAGASDGRGRQATPRAGFAQDLSHAGDLVFGRPGFRPESNYLTWTPRDTRARAQLFFRSGEPFEGVFLSANQKLVDANAIRNRVAHNSPKARADFKKVALRHLGQPTDGTLPQGYAPGDLLVELAARGFPQFRRNITYFNAYIRTYRQLADELVPE